MGEICFRGNIVMKGYLKDAAATAAAFRLGAFASGDLACAVVARPDAHWGETPCAFVETRAGATLDGASLLAFAKGRLAGFKALKSVVFGAAATSTGKIQKFALRDRARAL
ncbi:ligase [Aureococcus anophagefferens]|nr:ligase [Aureococcus anophagefferens]